MTGKDLVLSPEMQVLVGELKNLTGQLTRVGDFMQRSEERELVRQAVREAARQPKPCKFCGQPIKWAMKDNPAPNEFPRKPVNPDGSDHVCEKRGAQPPATEGLKTCNRCGEPIKFTKKDGRWLPLNPDGTQHYCHGREEGNVGDY